MEKDPKKLFLDNSDNVKTDRTGSVEVPDNTDNNNDVTSQTEDHTTSERNTDVASFGNQFPNGSSNEASHQAESEVDKRFNNINTGDFNNVEEKLDYGMSLLQDSIYYDKEYQVPAELIHSLTEGFTEKFLPSLEKNRKTISQIKASQSVLIETVQQENAKFADCRAVVGLEKTMAKAKIYHTKLLKLRRDMTTLHEKSARLKKRALKLQQHKQKEEMNRAQQQEMEYEKEKLLVARVAQTPANDGGMQS